MLLFSSVVLMAVGAQADGTFQATTNVVSSKNSAQAKKVKKNIAQSTQGTSNTTDDDTEGVSGSTENIFTKTNKAAKKDAKSVSASVEGTTNSISSNKSNKKYSFADHEVIIDQAAVFVAVGEIGADFEQFYHIFNAAVGTEYSPEFVAVNIEDAVVFYNGL